MLYLAGLDKLECSQVSFLPEISASYGLSIMLLGIPIRGSPFKVRVRNDETIAAHCRLYGPSLASGTAGVQNTFFVQGAHIANNNIIIQLADSYRVSC